MEDKRENILVRINEILTEVAVANPSAGIKVYRNQVEFETAQNELPAYVLLDGIENSVVESSDKRGPQVMVLEPQIFYVPVPTENPQNVGVGPSLSTMRSTLLKAILLDGKIASIVGSNGYVRYRGLETDMQTGGEVKGQFRLDLAFAYVFNVNKL